MLGEKHFSLCASTPEREGIYAVVGIVNEIK